MSNCCVCGQSGDKQCGRCYARNYCGSECQRQDWKTHKPNCNAPGVPEEYAMEFIQKVLSARIESEIGDKMSEKKQEWFLAVYPELRKYYAHVPTEEQKAKLTSLLVKAGGKSCRLDHVWRTDAQGLSRWQRPNLQLLCDQGTAIGYSCRVFQAGSCHAAAATLAAEGKCIGTGFGLSEASQHPSWVPHSWEVKDGKVVELTSNIYKKYWGITLTEQQAVEFTSLYCIKSDDIRRRILRNGLLQDKSQGIGALYFERGVQFSNGKAVKKNLSVAFDFFKAGAALDHPESQHNVGTFYFQGLGDVKQDVDIAKRYFSLAASQGLSAALSDLGVVHYTAGEHAKAVEYFQEAADKGNAPAQYSMYICYMAGEGVPKDQTKALQFLRLSSKQGHVESVELLRQYEKAGQAKPKRHGK